MFYFFISYCCKIYLKKKNIVYLNKILQVRSNIIQMANSKSYNVVSARLDEDLIAEMIVMIKNDSLR